MAVTAWHEAMRERLEIAGYLLDEVRVEQLLLTAMKRSEMRISICCLCDGTHPYKYHDRLVLTALPAWEN